MRSQLGADAFLAAYDPIDLPTNNGSNRRARRTALGDAVIRSWSAQLLHAHRVSAGLLRDLAWAATLLTVPQRTRATDHVHSCRALDPRPAGATVRPSRGGPSGGGPEA